MDPYLLIVIQSIALPFGLSGLLSAWSMHRDAYKVIGNALVWLIAYAWIIRWPEFPPGEAIDWPGPLLVASVAAGCITYRTARWLFRSVIFLIAIMAIAWPVLHYQPSLTLVSELVFIIITGVVLFRRMEHRLAVTPAFILAIQATGLAVASALSGSLLVGQLAAALTAVTGTYAFPEILDRLHKTPFSIQHRLAFLPLYLALLTIARLYAELPLVVTVLLLSGPILSVLVSWRHNWMIHLLLNAGAIGLVILNSDNTAYY